MNTLLSRLLRRPTRNEPPTWRSQSIRARLRLVATRPLNVLKDAQRRFGFTIDEVDIDQDPDLVAKYNTEVPVVTVNGKVRFRGVVNPALLERLLVAESRQQGSSGV